MISNQREKHLLDLEKKIGVSFLSKPLLDQALTHSSFAYESREKTMDNERLEFLGDAVLKLVVSDYLFQKFPDRDEGELTKIRASAISDVTLASVSQKIRLGTYLLLGSNENRTGGTTRKSNLANAFEALLGAVYLDAGIGRAREMTIRFLLDEIEKMSKAGYVRDFKSALQEFVQKKGWGLPIYEVIKETGPKHRRVFWINARIKDKIMGTGRGPSKKEAEQSAAKFALSSIKKIKGKTDIGNDVARNLIAVMKEKISSKRRKFL